MALVGEAHVVVRAITKNVERDIKRSFSGLNSVGSRSGDSLGRSFSRGFNRQVNANTFKRVADGIRSLVPGAEAARRAFSSLVRTGYTLGTALSSIVGGISAVIGGLGALGGAALGAMGSVAALGNVLFSVFAGMQVAKMALGGVGKAISAANNPTGGGGGSGGSAGTAGSSNAAAVEQANAAARAAAAQRVAEAERALALVIERNREDMVDANNDVRDAQLELNEALKEGREEIQQLGFDAEDAALAEQKAAIELGRAREALLRVQDLPPNSRARQEAELAFAEAELNLRKAKDRSADLNKEQDRLARTGVNGTAGVIAATDALARAESARAKAARDAMRDEAQAAQDLIDAKKEAASAGQDTPTSSAGSAGSAGSGGGGVDPYAGLNAAQEAFARFIVSLKPKFDELNRIAAESFLPKLQIAIETLMTKAFPVVAMGVGIIGSAMGDAAISIANAMTSAVNLERLGALFVSSGVIIQGLGNIIGSLWGIALSVMTAAIPLAERFVAFMETRFKGIDEYLNTTEGTAALNNFMTLAGDAMAQIGRILDNVFGGIGDIIMANLGPGTGGQYMLDWLEGATQKFDDIGNNPALQQFFLDVSINATKVMGSIGALIGELIKLGDNQAIGVTFDKLAEGAPIVGRIIEKTLEAGPILADLVVKVLEIIDAFTDTGAIQTFFGVLDTVAGVVRDMFANESLQGVLEITGRVLAFVSALSLIGSLGATGFRIVAGGVVSLMNVMSVLTGGISSVVRVMGLLSIANLKSIAETIILHGMYAKDAILKGAAATKTLALAAAEAVANGARKAAAAVQWLLNAALSANPIGLIIAGIAALVAGLVWFFTQTELGQAVWAEFTRFIGEAWDNIVGFVKGAIDFIVNLFLTWHPLGIIISNWEPIVQFFTDLWNSIVGFVQTQLQIIHDVIVGVTSAISSTWNAVWEAISTFFSTIWNAIVGFVTTYINVVMTIITTVVTTIQSVWNGIWTAISTFFSDIWNSIVGFVTTYIDTVRTIIDNVLNIINAIWTGQWDTIGTFLENIWKAITKYVDTAIKTVRDVIDSVIKVISSIWNTVWSGISSFFGTLWNGIVTIVQTYINTVRTIISAVITAISSTWSAIWNGISSFFATIWAGIVATVQNVGNTFGDVFRTIASVVEGAFNGVVSVVKGIINNIINLVNGAISGINGIVNTVGGALGFSVTIPKIPRLAKGGTVMPSAGGSIVNVAEAGRPERVEPLDPNGLSARDHAIMDKFTGTRPEIKIQIDIHADKETDTSELAAMVGRELAYQLRKGGF